MSLTDTVPQARRRDLRIPLAAVLIVLALAAPFIGTRYVTHSLIIALIFMLPAHGLNLLVGYTGLLSLAQAAFFGIGAYTAGLLAVHFETPFYVNLIASGLVTGAIALPLGIPALRLRSTSFARFRHHRPGNRQELDLADPWRHGPLRHPETLFRTWPTFLYRQRNDQFLLSGACHLCARHACCMGDRPLAGGSQHGRHP